MLVRTSAVVVLAGLVGVGLVKPGVPSPEPTVSQFLLAWESQRYLEAAQLTTGPPKAVAAALARAYERLDASNLNLSIRSIRQHGKTAIAGVQCLDRPGRHRPGLGIHRCVQPP